MSSLSARLLAVVSLLLVVFFGLTILVLEGSFRRAAERAVQDGLDVRLIMLLSAAQSDGDQVTLPDPLPEPRFSTPGSGLLGQVTAGVDELVWRSPSAVGVFLPQSYLAAPGERRFARLEASDGEDVFALSFAVSWEGNDSSDDAIYTFTVAESSAPFFAQVSRFRRQLLGSFAALAALLLASQALVLRWVLRPLRQVEDEIGEIEAGERSELSAGYPSELAGLTRNTNRLIRAERQRLARYRNTLGNLAHSLKTPLAVLRNTMAGADDARGDIVQTQIDRMNDIVGYQLQRAAAAGGITLGQEPVPVMVTLHSITDALGKVYADKGVRCDVTGDDDAQFLGDRGDLMEILGNVLDNAFKWCRSRVRVQVTARARDGARRRGVSVSVDDDGAGIAREQRVKVLARGARADQSVAGQGIGLAVVQELIELVEGELRLDTSDLGGARVRIDI